MNTPFIRTAMAMALLALCGAATAQDHAAHGATPPAAPTATATATTAADEDMTGMEGLDMSAHAHHQMPAHGDHAMPGKDHASAMTGAFGPYPMAREASGTSWQPDNTAVDGIHQMNGPWMTMYHGFINTVYDHQGGPRGDNLAFSESMFMAMASRPLGNGTLGLRAMVSLDPLIGKRGYPLLFQTGETADGHNALVDRQHPHDLLMELSASYSLNLGNGSSAFVYAGLPGEPALGPPAFMHRVSGMDNPEAPLTHHWLDSTHITFGVVTAGYVWRDVKLEASSFNGREPDQFRWNVETRKLDSASARLSWNPSADWSLQVSHGRLKSPESLEPDVMVHRTTASAMVQKTIGGMPTQTTLAWGRNRHDPGTATNAYLLESSMRVRPDTTVFGRFESVQNGELFGHGHGDGDSAGGAVTGALQDRVFNIKKLSVGVVHDFAQLGPVKFGVGGVASAFAKPAALDTVYGDSPSAWMLFFRAKLAL
jgi:hypothetical protein